MSFFDDTRFVIQCDRRGYKDLITEICGINLCSDEFLEDIKYQNFGYAKEHGLTTDVGTLKERQLPVCAINVSCGYYNPHSDEEITVKADLLNCLRFVESIIENCTKVYPHHWVDRYDPFYCQYEYDELYNELWEILENNPHQQGYLHADLTYAVYLLHFEILVHQRKHQEAQDFCLSVLAQFLEKQNIDDISSS